MKNYKIFLVIAVCSVAIAFAAKSFALGEVAQAVFAVPFAVALIGCLISVLRDVAAKQHAEWLQNQNHAFILSATSHMANVAFDKHVAFAEKYVLEVQRCLGELFRKGATEDAFDLARSLYAVRREFLLWETESISKKLDEFEQALQNMGAQMHGLRDIPPSEERSRKVDEVWGILKKILDLRDAPQNLSEEIVGKMVIQRMRELLGVEEWTALRRHYLDEALNRSRI
ncbi:MAG: hypothetical protein ABSG78_14550 [Verrucomicrobiota bacterium]|jgi:hypothetical protein